jgi:hypothetical protein
MIDRWIEEIKLRANPEELGMILVHNGLVRATSKSGKPVRGMKLSYDKEKLIPLFSLLSRKPGLSTSGSGSTPGFFRWVTISCS